MTDITPWPSAPTGLIFGAVYEAGGVLLRLCTLSLWEDGWEAKWTSLDPEVRWFVEAWSNASSSLCLVDVQLGVRDSAGGYPTIGTGADKLTDVPSVIAAAMADLDGKHD